MGADQLDLSVLPAERRRFLATMGRRLTGQALTRRDPQRRYPILLTVLAQSVTDVLDEVIGLFDQAISAREGKAERRMREVLAERGKSGENRQALLDDLLDIIFDTDITDERIGWQRLRAAQQEALPRLPRDHGHLAALDGSYGYLRQFTPHLLETIRFAGGTAAAELLEAALRRDLLYAHEGTVRARHVEAQTEQAWALTLTTNSVIAWTTEYYGLAVESMRRTGRQVDDELLAHISPVHSENVNFFGAIEVDIEGELAQLGPTGYRPLWIRDTLF